MHMWVIKKHSIMIIYIYINILPRNLGECFVSLFVEPIARKNVSLSDKKNFGDFLF